MLCVVPYTDMDRAHRKTHYLKWTN